MLSITQSLLALALCAGTTFASPIADPQYMYGNPVPMCSDTGIVYHVTENHTISAPPQTGDYTVKGGQGLSASSTFSIGTTITTGIDLSITKIAALGFSASTSTTTTNSQTEGTSNTCPTGPWYCALQIYPELMQITGTTSKDPNAGPTCAKTPQDYQVALPHYGTSGRVRSRTEICACGNFKGWAEPGAPSLVCQDCASPIA